MTTDPEYDRLRDAVIADWAYYGRSIGTDRENDARQDAEHSSREFRAYRTKSTPPDPVPLRVEPPEEFRRMAVSHHWLADSRSEAITPFTWHGDTWYHNGRFVMPTDMHESGWRYHSPCKPDTRIEPTDEAIEAAPKRVQTFVGKPCSHSYPARSPTQPAPVQQSEVDELRAQKDGAYLERNQVVAGLASLAIKLGYRAGKAKTAIEGWSEDWHGCAYIDLPTGQVSWHYHDSQAHLFEFLPAYTASWDGHDTPEKYRRVLSLRTPAEQLCDCGGLYSCGEWRHTQKCAQTRSDIARAKVAFPAHKHTPTITKDQWEEIRKLAISNAPESFPYGVAKVLGR